MTLTLSGVAVAVLTAFLVWSMIDRLWHLLVIAVLAVPLLPLLAATVTGDVSRYLPAWMFSDGAGGKNEVIFASVAATLLLAILLAAGVFGAAKAGWRRWR
jgi:hypothetical protein